MAYTTINKSSDYFNTKLYTGTGSSNALTGINFQPDLTWIKKRDGTNYHVLTDAVRLATKQIYSNDTGAEQAVAEGLKSFDSDGFTLGTNGDTNGNSGSYCSWNWKANGAGSANTDGDINSTVSVNTTSGFSIVKYTGTGSNATVGHGLGVAPSMIIFKRLVGSGWNWTVYHKSMGNNYFMSLNLTNAKSNTSSSTYFQDTTPTSSVFSIGNSGHLNGDDIIAYCFAEKQGYSKFGRFTANGSTDNAFVYTGFKPSWVMMKCDSVTEGWSNWYMFDTTRNPTNMNTKELMANKNNVESDNGADYAQIDMLSNGFKIRNGSAWGPMASGRTNIYMAFAEAPLVGSNNVPCTAR